MTEQTVIAGLHTAAAPEKQLPEKQLVVLAGNPNVGKSVFFNGFTGQYVNVSNFPGTTVDIPKGKLPNGRPIHDTPGVYGLSGMSEEEQVAENTILSADVIVNVVSAISLERDLFLTQQLLDFGKPLLVALNQMDEAALLQITIDIPLLSKRLGVPVIPCIATEGNGLDHVLLALTESHSENAPRLGNRLPDAPEPNALLELEKNPGERMHIYGLRRHYINALVSQVVKQAQPEGKPIQRLSQAIGMLFLNPFIGLLSGLIVLLALYQVVGIWVAGDLVNFTEKTVMLKWVVPFLKQAVSLLASPKTPLFEVLAGEFGVLTMSVQYIFGVLFPLVLGFYIYISLLEDCGYLPRIAVLSDGLLSKIGLNGRAVIPLILGLGCVTMATVSTRVLTSQRERTIASTILAITIPCSAQLGVIIGLMAVTGGLKAWAVYCAILFTVLLVLGTLLNKMLPGSSTSLILDLPPMRLPMLKNVAKKTWVRTVVFLKEASPLFILGSLLVSILQVSGLLLTIQHALAPVTESLLHLPGATAKAFIMGMVRRDFGAAGLYFLAKEMTAIQMMTALIVITLFVPCIASATVIWKERGIRESSIVLVGSWLLAFGVGAVLCRFLEWTHIL
ncbi:MAG: ferrous iron transport protein B [Cyanobacteria bacterium]|nr:ferrous iron transport protein B [Cyanobacteriota bacterium]